MSKRVLLCIMDGYGINPNKNSENYDDKNLSPPVNIPKLKETEKYTQSHADGEYVGLPDGQMGNSEVGHMNLGAGRVVYQELTKINKSIREGEFFKNEQFLAAIKNAKDKNSSLHIYGLVSTGGVHSSFDHLLALIKLCAEEGLKKVYIHAFLYGRDTPPQSACSFLEPLEKELVKYKLPPIATVSGRYYAMDRDNRWDRVEKAYNCLVFGEGQRANSAIEAVKNSYANGINDEFVLPTAIGNENQIQNSRINDNDSVIFINFRPDRAREISKAVNFKEFDGFNRKVVRKNIFYVTMTQYDASFDFPVACPPQKLTNILGEVLENNGVHQFRTAETEKYAHVTFFFNGGKEEPFPHETRKLVKSPSVATYDLQPEMSAAEVCENVLEAEKNSDYGFILVNFANPDMVGHTGVIEAATKACKVVDECVGKIVEEARKQGIAMLLTADHGNAETMIDPETGKVLTAHTTNEVPFFLINADKNIGLKETGALCDVAPTVVDLLGLKQPEDMTGKSLLT